MKTARIAVALAWLAAFGAGAAVAGDPVGIWLTEHGKARIRVAHCGSALCGTIVWLKEPNDPSGKPLTDQLNADATKRGRPVIGIAIAFGMKPAGSPNKWVGQVYNVEEDGKIYSGSLTLTSPSTLKLEGCLLGGLVCKGETWTRLN